MEAIKLYPQVTKSAIVNKKVPLDTIVPIQELLKKVDLELGDKGRVLVRYSGTEPLARVMVEGERFDQVNRLCDELVEVVSKELGQ